MAKGKQRAWHVLDGLYRDVEDARRHFEHGTSPEGSAAYSRWLEILEIAEWHLDDADVEEHASDGESPGQHVDGPDEGRPQLDLPATGGLGSDVPRGTSKRVTSAADHVDGAAPGLTTQQLQEELQRRGLTPAGKQKFGCGERGRA